MLGRYDGLRPRSPARRRSLAAIPETGIDMSTALGSGRRYLHYLLMYEQGHIVDFRYLTNRQRGAFMRLWHMSIPAGDTISEAWWAGESSGTKVHYERVPGERFSDSFAMCALVKRWTVQVASAYTWTAFSPVSESRSCPSSTETASG